MHKKTLTAICSGHTLAVLPVFMVAGLVPQIRDALSLSQTQVGLAITTALIVSATAAIPAGRLTDRMGPSSTVAIGTVFSVLSLTGLGTMTTTFAALLGFLAISGVAIALVSTGFAHVIASEVPAGRRGFAFGVKEAAIPAASLAVGFAIPLLAVTLGWQWTVYVGVIPLILLVFTFPRVHSPVRDGVGPDRSQGDEPVQISRPALAAGAAAMATVATAGVKVFLTETAVTGGMSAGAVGILLAVAGLSGVIARIEMGRQVDHRTGKAVEMTAVLMLIGSVAMVAGAIAWPPLLVPAAIGVFAGGAGWSGLFLYALVESRPEAAGAAAGVGIAGVTVGGALGPVAFGLAIEHWSLTVAWVLAAVLIGTASLVMTVAGRRARVELAQRGTA